MSIKQINSTLNSVDEIKRLLDNNVFRGFIQLHKDKTIVFHLILIIYLKKYKSNWNDTKHLKALLQILRQDYNLLLNDDIQILEATLVIVMDLYYESFT